MRHLLLYSIIALLICSCSSVKYVPDNEYLLDKIEINNSARNISNEKFKPYIKQNPNVQIFGLFKFHLGMYNLAGRDSAKGINKWLKRVGEKPVLYDDFLAKKTAEEFKLFMQNKGYFYVSVVDTAIVKRKKKVKLRFDIEAGRQFKLNQVNFKAEDTVIQRFVLEDADQSLLKKGKPFDVAMHDAERERITKSLRDRGFYEFSKEFIYFRVDSSKGEYIINDSILIKNPRKEFLPQKDTALVHTSFRVKDVFFRMNYDSHLALNEKETYFNRFDTLRYGDFYFLYIDKIGVKPEVLINSTYILPGQLYQTSLVDKTQSLLSGLKLYRFINIRFEVTDQPDSDSPNDEEKWLNCYIQLVPAKSQSYSVDIEGLNSSGNLGAGGNFEYQHKNLFKGAEQFTLSLGASMQNQFNRQSEEFNTQEVGVEAGIVFPKFWMPFKVQKFRQRYNPKTSLSTAYNYQRRPDYTRTIANGKLSYLWKSGKYLSHQVTPVGINFVLISDIDSTFESEIEDTYLEYSYKDHLITNISYSLVYNQQEVNRKKDFWYLSWNIEEAGNLLNLGMSYLSSKTDSGYYEVLGNRYAQYVQSDVDIRYHHYLNKINNMAYRFYLGVGYPYGNYNVLPFEKRYFSGGANSVRAWPVRGLGPGSYNEDDDDYYNQTGDIKLELNAEYRFKLFWILEGAFFVDVGNIYTIRKDISPDGGLFQFGNFASKLGVGTGLGMRFDFKYFIFRLDTGLKIHDPEEASGERWIPASRRYTWDDTAFNFAIGYPF